MLKKHIKLTQIQVLSINLPLYVTYVYKFFLERLWASNFGNLHGGPAKIGTANNGPHARAGLWRSYSYNAKYYGHFVYASSHGQGTHSARTKISFKGYFCLRGK